MKPFVRGIYCIEDEKPDWREIISIFPNNVPRFQSKDEAIIFLKKHCKVGSNPVEPRLTHSITTLTDWDQITRFLLPKIEEYSSKFPKKTYESVQLSSNIYFNNNPVSEYLGSRFNLPIYNNISDKSTFNTLKYLFYHMRCGIYVMIRDNRIVLFCPFVNKNYSNTWGNILQVDSIDGSIDTYFQEKSHHYRSENYIKDKMKWWANGNIICNELNSVNDSETQYWGDQFLFQLKDMIAETCSQREISDCEFFINKRDYPHLKFNADRGRAVEPYGFIYDKDDRIPEDDVELARHLYKAYTPILSFYTSERFADIPIPPSEDWEAATGEVFPSSFSHSYDQNGNVIVQEPRDLFIAKNLIKFRKDWNDKKPTALFRGTATGGGTTTETNQRIHLADLSHKWSKNPKYNGEDKQYPYPYLDAKITGWNLRDKKIFSSKMKYVHKNNFEFTGDKQKNFIPIYEQSSYKYVIYAEGHCAACRYAFMMLLDSVILKVDSLCVADKIWYFPLLKPFYDHVPVKADLSNLDEMIEWCRNHDDECKQIAKNAREVYNKYISRNAILDYLQLIFTNISKRYIHRPTWVNNLYNKQDISHYEQYLPPEFGVTKNSCCDAMELCSTCKILKENDDKIRRITQLQSNETTNSTSSSVSIDEIKKRRRLENIAKAREIRMKDTTEMKK